MMKTSSKVSLIAIGAGIIAITVLVSGCGQTEKPIMQFMPHMSNTSTLKAQQGYDAVANGASVMEPPAGTVARGYKPYHFQTPEEADKLLKNPLPRNAITLARGEKIFKTYCLVCHGERGHGDGPVVNPFPIPKSLQSDNMLKWGDGHLYHVITMGQGVMPSYAQQIQRADRWAVIHYVRALQRADHPTEEDIREYQKRVVK